MNYANIFAAICFKTQPKYANICFKTQGKFSVTCRILLLLEKTPLKEHLLARADTLPYQAKRGNFAIISSFYLIPYFPTHKITTFPPTFQILPQLFPLNHDFFVLNQPFFHKKRRVPAFYTFILLLICEDKLNNNPFYAQKMIHKFVF